jgi:hypothetical protein
MSRNPGANGYILKPVDIGALTGPAEAFLLRIFERPDPARADDFMKEQFRSSLFGLGGSLIAHTVFSRPVKSWNAAKMARMHIRHCLQSLGDTSDPLVLAMSEVPDISVMNVSAFSVWEEKILSAIRRRAMADIQGMFLSSREYFGENAVRRVFGLRRRLLVPFPKPASPKARSRRGGKRIDRSPLRREPDPGRPGRGRVAKRLLPQRAL